MRVVLATHARTFGGVWRHMLDLGTGLQDRGVAVAVAGPDGATQPERRAREAGLSWTGLRTALLAPADVWHLHLADTYYRPAPFLIAARFGRGGALVLTEHLPRTDASDPTLLPGRRRLGARTAKTALKRIETAGVHRLIALSAGSHRFLNQRYGLTQGISVVPHGIRVGGDPGPPEPAPVLRVLAIGAVVAQKGHDVLVEAARLAQRRWTATVVGEGPARTRLSELADHAPRRVTFVGWEDDVATAIRRVDAVAMPSRWESFGYAALEAMAGGRPVVASDVDGLEELVVHNRTGLLVAPDDPRALAAALDKLAGDREACVELGRAAHRHAASKFTLDRMVDDTMAVYAQALTAVRRIRPTRRPAGT
jgi:glycosyltransferase involved in cell wall biosynthesis